MINCNSPDGRKRDNQKLLSTDFIVSLNLQWKIVMCFSEWGEPDSGEKRSRHSATQTWLSLEESLLQSQIF